METELYLDLQRLIFQVILQDSTARIKLAWRLETNKALSLMGSERVS
jgi:hypothetical protein